MLLFEKRRDEVTGLPVAPVLQTVERMESLLSIGGGEGAFCCDIGVLVIDEVSSLSGMGSS